MPTRNFTDLPLNITGPVEYFDWVAGITGLFWPIMLMALWVIIFVNGLGFGASRSWTVSSLVCGIIGIGVAILGWMNPNYMYLFGVLFALGLFWRSLESGQGN